MRNNKLRGTKLAYAFAKADRFPSNKPECPVAFYKAFLEPSQRKASIGYGAKFDFTKQQINKLTPAPGIYDVAQFLKPQKKLKISFGLGRQQVKDNSYIQLNLKQHPGLNRYTPKKPSKSVSFSMGCKLSPYQENKKTFKQNPGPGAYQSKNLFNPQNRVTSVNHGIRSYSYAKTSRFSQNVDGPSPHSYHPYNDIFKEGRYVLSNNKNNGKYLFGKDKRISFVDISKKGNPGPGQYEVSLDFGLDEQILQPKSKMYSTIQ